MLSHVQLFVTLWTEVFQAPLSMKFSRQKYYSQFPALLSRHLPKPGISVSILESPALAGRFFTTAPPID